MTASGPDLDSALARTGRPGGVWGAGWRSFRSRPEQVLVPVLIAGGGWLVAQVIVQIALSSTITQSRPCLRRVAGMVEPSICAADGTRGTIGLALGVFAFFFLGQLFWAATVRAGLNAIPGEAPRPWRATLGPVLGVAVVLGIAITLGSGLGFLPGVVIGLCTQFAMVAVIADGHGCFAAINRSIGTVVRHLPSLLGFSGLAVLVILAGGLLGLVGVWPASALVALAQLHLWRRHHGRPSA